MKRFFISYRRSESDSSELAATLNQRLISAGHETFIDVSMQIGTDWVKEIAGRIDWCDYLIVLLSEGARDSEMVQTEVRFAHQRSKRQGTPVILPVRVNFSGRLDYELESYLGRIQYVAWGTPDDTPRLLQQILAAAESSTPLAVSTTAATSAAPEEPRDARRPETRIDARILTDPGDSDPEDPFYIQRTTDCDLVQAAQRPRGETIIIKGAPRMGKSSLLIRYLAGSEKAGKQICFVDFTTFSHKELQSFETIVRELANALTSAAGIDPPGETALKSTSTVSKWIQDNVLAPSDKTYILALDAVDRVLGREYQTEFFTMLRLWHNNRATDLKRRWKKLGLALVISTEPYLLIDVEFQSPFSVVAATPVEVFTVEECAALNGLYGSPLSERELSNLYELLGGHPYLTRLALFRLVSGARMTFSALMEKAAQPQGPFGEHLKALFLLFHDKVELLNVYRQLIQSGVQPAQVTFDRLRGVGLVRRDGPNAVPANLLYARFFKNVL